MTYEALTLGIVWYVAFLFSTVCHEGAHALVGLWGGDRTAFEGGQVTLNPVPHIRREPLGLVLVPILSYALSYKSGGWMLGWASAPYDPDWSRRHPRRAAWMALAGPAANLILAILAGIAIHIGIASGRLEAPDAPTITHITELAGGGVNLATTFLSILFMLNLLLFTFNLLPVPPLDGVMGVTLLMREDTGTRFVEWAKTGGMGIFGLLIAWYAFGYIYNPLFLFALKLLYPSLHYHYTG
jgi:Zn-dependent protease